jgi:hypothetical protein
MWRTLLFESLFNLLSIYLNIRCDSLNELLFINDIAGNELLFASDIAGRYGLLSLDISSVLVVHGDDLVLKHTKDHACRTHRYSIVVATDVSSETD